MSESTNTATDRPRKRKVSVFQKILSPKTLFTKISDNQEINDGYYYLGKRRFDDAINCFQNVIKEDNQSTDAYVGLGKTYCAQEGIKNTKQGLEFLQKAVQTDPTRLDIYNEIINIYERLGDKRKAATERKKQFIAKTLKSNPNDAKANNNMGIIQLQQNNTDAAITSFKKAIKLNKSFPTAKQNLSNAFLQKAMATKNEEEKAFLLKQSLGLINQVIEGGKSAEALLIKAKALLSRNEFDQAASACDEALLLEPSMKEAFNTKRVIEERRGNIGKANEAFENFESMKEKEQKIRKEKYVSPFD